MKKYWFMNPEKKDTPVKNIYEKIIFTGKKEEMVPSLHSHTDLYLEHFLEGRCITKGKTYKILEEDESFYVIENDMELRHRFTKEKYSEWFELTK